MLGIVCYLLWVGVAPLHAAAGELSVRAITYEAQVIQQEASDHFPVLAVFSPPAREAEALVVLHDQESLAGSLMPQLSPL